MENNRKESHPKKTKIFHRRKTHSESSGKLGNYLPPHLRGKKNKSMSESNDSTCRFIDQPTCSAYLPKPTKNVEDRSKIIQDIRMDIQQKIHLEIVPKLEKISNEFARIQQQRESACTSKKSDSSEPQTSRNSKQDSKAVRIRTPRTPKEKVEENLVKNFERMSLKKENQRNSKVFRYSRKELLDMRGLATHKYLNRLSSIGILSNDRQSVLRALGIQKKDEIKVRSNLGPTDVLLLKLLELKSPEDRENMILKLAMDRKLAIVAADQKSYKIHPDLSKEIIKLRMEDLSQELTLESSPKRNRKPKTEEEENHLFEKKEELNGTLYQLHFLELFESILLDDEKALSVPEIIDRLVESKRAYFLEGELRINARNLQESYVSNERGKRDIRVTSIPLRKYALNGDIVRILVKPRHDENEVESEEPGISDDTTTSDSDLDPENPAENSKKKEAQEMERNRGCVLEILTKVHTRQTIGHFNSPSVSRLKKKQSFVPRDPRVPLILVPADQELEIKAETLYLVEITYWIREQPYGKLLKNIGKRNNLEVENLAILLQNNLNPQPFSEEILEQLPKLPFEIPKEEFAYRADLRKKCIFSIDPESARDLDDAVSCEILPNGNLEIGVHISDVTYFLKESSDLDMIVKEKATTIYLVDNVYHMLPVPLCMLCSLLPGTDKIAYSVFWEIVEETAEVVSTRFTRSIINSCAKLAYAHAQTIIENPGKKWASEDFPEIHNGFNINDVAFVIQKLQNVARVLRRNRKENGALKIDQPKIAFTLDPETGNPVGWHKHEQKESNQLIEEFMLLANISVAKMIYEKFPDISILRSHNSPSSGSVTKLIKTLQTNGIAIDTSSAKSISESMERAVHEAEYPDGTNAVLNVLVSKALTRARYFCSHEANYPDDFWHFALSVPIYTHFTSPIRRYADIMVHRVLNAALGYEDPPARDPEELHNLANNCNIQKYNAKIAGDDSSNLYFLQFVSAAKTLHMRAGVLGVFQYNFEVVLIESGHVIKIYYKNLEAKRITVKFCNVGEGKPSTATLIFNKLDKSPVKRVSVHSELTVAVSVSKNKLAINEVFAD